MADDGEEEFFNARVESVSVMDDDFMSATGGRFKYMKRPKE